MRTAKVKPVYWWFIRLLNCFVLSMALIGCGADGSGASEDIAVAVSLPVGETAELFWYGVSSRQLLSYRGAQLLDRHDWSPQNTIEAKLKAGDRLVFQGLDFSGKVIVQGEAPVGIEKNISIFVYRLL